jgi:hypothetical protein
MDLCLKKLREISYRLDSPFLHKPNSNLLIYFYFYFPNSFQGKKAPSRCRCCRQRWAWARAPLLGRGWPIGHGLGRCHQACDSLLFLYLLSIEVYILPLCNVFQLTWKLFWVFDSQIFMFFHVTTLIFMYIVDKVFTCWTWLCRSATMFPCVKK